MDELTNKFLTTDVSKYIEKKNGLSYLSWANAWREVLKVYPTATYNIKKDEQNRAYFGDEKVGYMVYTDVTIGDITHEMWLPVMNGANKAMMLTAYTYTTKYGENTVEPMTMFDVNKTIMRCLVKNLAMFGLGLHIYAGEDLPETEPIEYISDKQQHELLELATKAELTEEQVCKAFKISKFSQVPTKHYVTVLEAIKKKLEAKK
jgi:hypothetical protein